MISVNKNFINVDGNGVVLLSEMAVIAATLKNLGIPEQAILNVIKEGLKYSEVLHCKAEKKGKKLYEEVMKEIEKRKNAQTDEGNSNK